MQCLTVYIRLRLTPEVGREDIHYETLFAFSRVLMAKFKEDLLTSKESPTGRLLTEWEKRNKNLPQFVQAMKDIGRLDVVEAIKRIHGSTPRGSPAPTRAN